MAKNSPQDIINREYFSDNLNKFMKKKGIRQIDLHNKLGIPKSTLTGYVKGRSLPNSKNLQKLADFLGVSKSSLDLRYTPKNEEKLLNKADTWIEGMLEYIGSEPDLTQLDDISLDNAENMLIQFQKINSIATEYSIALLNGEKKLEIYDRLIKKYSEIDIILALRFLKILDTYPETFNEE